MGKAEFLLKLAVILHYTISQMIQTIHKILRKRNLTTQLQSYLVTPENHCLLSLHSDGHLSTKHLTTFI